MEDIKIRYGSIYAAWLAFKKSKKFSRAVDEFSYYAEAEIAKLSSEITLKKYTHGTYKKITIYEKKRRDLAVADVRDRVVHRLIYDYLTIVYDKSFDPDVWSCRLGKGLHKCLKRTRSMLQKYSSSYVWRADITKFFDHVEHGTLLKCLDRKLSGQSMAMYLCTEVVESYNFTVSSGVPIGNLTSQIFANIYLNEFDRFVRNDLKPQAYVRYGDDFILIAPSRRCAHEFEARAIDFLKHKLGLRLNPKNNVICPVKSGLHFLGHVITSSYVVVDKHTTKSVLGKVNLHNASSYKSLKLVKSAKESINRELVNQILDIV